jgi:RNAse (barnase) inhibitor barstar
MIIFDGTNFKVVERMFTEFDYKSVLNHCYGCNWAVIDKMTTSIWLYYPRRKNDIARVRCKSAIKVLRKAREELDKNA